MIPDIDLTSLRSAGACATRSGAFLFFAVSLSTGIAFGASETGPPAIEAPLDVRRSVVLEKSSGRVDQVLSLPDGGFAVRDYSWEVPEEQRIELFEASGRRRGTIERYGLGPGRYRRLADLSLGSDESLWVADYGAIRALQYSQKGEALRTLLVQNPSFRPRAIEVDPSRGVLYLAGCYPIDTYLDRGCLLVHRYDLDSGEFRGSFVETPAEVVERRWEGRSRYDLALGEDGAVYLLHQSSFDLQRLDPDSGEVTVVPIRAESAEEPPALTREVLTSVDGMREAVESSYRMERIETAGPWAAISIARPHGDGYRLVLLHDGRQVGADRRAPGRLVGTTGDGGFLFTQRHEDRFLLRIAYPQAADGGATR